MPPPAPPRPGKRFALFVFPLMMLDGMIRHAPHGVFRYERHSRLSQTKPHETHMFLFGLPHSRLHLALRSPGLEY